VFGVRVRAEQPATVAELEIVFHARLNHLVRYTNDFPFRTIFFSPKKTYLGLLVELCEKLFLSLFTAGLLPPSVSFKFILGLIFRPASLRQCIVCSS
jgi:hypothetical protein